MDIPGGVLTFGRRMIPVCIYCKEPHDASDFSRKAEHVLPQQWGLFENNLTLHRVVCKTCNGYFGDTLELYLGRDTPDGLNRFLYGVKDPSEYKSLGRRSTLEFRIESGPYAGARAFQRSVGTELVVQPLPQIGFGETSGAPHQWYLVDELPTFDEIKRLIDSGLSDIAFCGMDDPDPVLETLRGMGLQISEMAESVPAHWRDRGRVEGRTVLGHQFGRAVTKIALNYLASQYGAQTALMPQFDQARRYARYGESPPKRIWNADNGTILKDEPNAFGHILTVAWHPQTSTVLAQVSFHNTSRYQVILSSGAFALGVPFTGSGHFFDLSTKRVVQLTPAFGIP